MVLRGHFNEEGVTIKCPREIGCHRFGCPREIGCPRVGCPREVAQDKIRVCTNNLSLMLLFILYGGCVQLIAGLVGLQFIIN